MNRFKKALDIANQYAIKHGSLPPSFDAFREEVEGIKKAEGKMDKSTLGKMINAARDYFDVIGDGAEAVVFDVGSDKVLKIYRWHTEAARGEYVIFADPQFKDVTPDVHAHGDDWGWIVVEKVDVLKNWKKIERHFPELWEKALDLQVHERQHTNIHSAFSALIKNFDLYESTIESKREREWAQEVKRLHDVLGVEGRFDIKPANLGTDSRGNIVLIDLYLDEVIVHG
jgi:hypothetical protein